MRGTLTDGLREGEALGLAGLAVMDGLGLLRGLVMAFTVRIPGSVPREVVPPREVSPPREVIERTERTCHRPLHYYWKHVRYMISLYVLCTQILLC